MVSCKALGISSAVSACVGGFGFIWLFSNTERGNNRFRTGVGMTSLALVVGGGMGLLFFTKNVCESNPDRVE
jgi:hypothetical protein